MDRRTDHPLFPKMGSFRLACSMIALTPCGPFTLHIPPRFPSHLGSRRRGNEMTILDGRKLLGIWQKVRKAEFEELLRGNNSSTKVISFSRNGPVKRDITHPESGLSDPLQSPPSRRTRPDISSPLFMAAQEEPTPHPSTPAIQTGTQPAVQGTGNTNKRHFRLPTGLPHSLHRYRIRRPRPILLFPLPLLALHHQRPRPLHRHARLSLPP